MIILEKSFRIECVLFCHYECSLDLTVPLFLGCDLDLSLVLPGIAQDSEEFKRLVEYVKNTHGATHTMYELEVMEIFKVARHGEEEQFKSFSIRNRQLLWHGSRTTNFSGILSQVSGQVWWLVGLDECVLYLLLVVVN